MVEKGLWRRVVNEVGQLIGYQPVAAEPKTIMPSDGSRAALGAAETKAIAGLMGKSRTAGLSDAQRRERIHPKSGRLLPEEDFIERAQKLEKAYPHSANYRDIDLARHGKLRRELAPGGDRAVRVYPKG